MPRASQIQSYFYFIIRCGTHWKLFKDVDFNAFYYYNKITSIQLFLKFLACNALSWGVI
jgi:hypothetical protein